VIGRLAKYGGGGYPDGREPFVLRRHRDHSSHPLTWPFTCTKIVIIGGAAMVDCPDFS
jgi:hypothetical protein